MQSLKITTDVIHSCTIVASKIKGTAREIYSICFSAMGIFPVCTPVYVQGKSPEV